MEITAKGLWCAGRGWAVLMGRFAAWLGVHLRLALCHKPTAADPRRKLKREGPKEGEKEEARAPHRSFTTLPIWGIQRWPQEGREHLGGHLPLPSHPVGAGLLKS